MALVPPKEIEKSEAYLGRLESRKRRRALDESDSNKKMK